MLKPSFSSLGIASWLLFQSALCSATLFFPSLCFYVKTFVSCFLFLFKDTIIFLGNLDWYFAMGPMVVLRHRLSFYFSYHVISQLGIGVPIPSHLVFPQKSQNIFWKMSIIEHYAFSFCTTSFGRPLDVTWKLSKQSLFSCLPCLFQI